MLATSIALVLFSLCANVNAQEPQLRCRRCNRVQNYGECNSFAVCVAGEVCYMDQIITDSNNVVYDGGCRAADVCGTHVGKRSDIVACTRCCTSEYCNEHLCGLKADLSYQNRTLCNMCDGMQGRRHPTRYPEDCPFQGYCAADEVCFSSTSTFGEKELRHYTSCRNRQQCVQLMKAITNIANSPMHSTYIGRRESNVICSACCTWKDCSKHSCEYIKDIFGQMVRHELIDMDTLNVASNITSH